MISVPLIVTEINPGSGFKVEISTPQSINIPFDWLMINTYGEITSPNYVASSTPNEPQAEQPVIVNETPIQDNSSMNTSSSTDSGVSAEATEIQDTGETGTTTEEVVLNEPDTTGEATTINEPAVDNVNIIAEPDSGITETIAPEPVAESNE